MRVTLGTAPEGIVLILKEDVKIVNTATGSMIKQSEDVYKRQHYSPRLLSYLL